MPCEIYLMEWQEEAALSTARFITLLAGRRAGKTNVIQGRIKLRTETPKFRYTYISPLSQQGNEVYDEMRSDNAWMTRVVVANSRPYPHFKLFNGSVIWFRSWQRPEGIKGTGENEICLDESQERILTEYSVSRVVMPMLSDRRGTLFMAGQFRGLDWRYEKFWIPGQKFKINPETGESTGEPNPKYSPVYQSWRFPTRMGYLFQGEDGVRELELMRSICPTQEIWDEQWECIPRANANAVFKPSQVDAISIEASPRVEVEKEPMRSGGYCTCIDLGGIQDPLGLIVGHASGDIVFAKEWPLGMDDEELAREAIEIANIYGGIVVVDATGKGKPGATTPNEERIELYRKNASIMGLEFQDTYQTANKERLLMNLRTAIQRKEIRIAAALTSVTTQLKSYEFNYNPKTKAYVYGAPQGQHDEFVSCGIMFREAMNRNWISRSSRGRSIGAMFG